MDSSTGFPPVCEDYLVRYASCMHDYGIKMLEPFTLYRPRICKDGNQWCVLYGENLQDGVAGFGDTPALAVEAFNKAWGEK